MLQENYPQLKSNENFLRLQDELAGTENRIAVERRKYNEAVQHYNTDISLFPANIVAGMFGFQRNDAYFKTEPGAQKCRKFSSKAAFRAEPVSDCFPVGIQYAATGPGPCN